MSAFFGRLRATALLMVGQPSYEVYRQHMAKHHPEREPMTRIEFFRDREAARYDGSGSSCC